MPDKINTIKDLKIFIYGQLEGLYPDNEITAMTSIIIRTILKQHKLHYPATPETKISGVFVEYASAVCSNLKKYMPIQYAVGETEFYGCIIKIDGKTLIPRPETEELTDLIIKENQNFKGSIIDAGSGSGAIGIALSRNLPGANVFCSDISLDALKLTAENSRLNNVRIELIHDDILNPTPDKYPSPDILVSNPPYVRESEKAFMLKNVLDYEPHEALFVPDEDPLKFYRAILNLCKLISKKQVKVYFEINEALSDEVNMLLEAYSCSEIVIMKDLTGRTRFAKCIYHGH